MHGVPCLTEKAKGKTSAARRPWKSSMPKPKIGTSKNANGKRPLRAEGKRYQEGEREALSERQKRSASDNKESAMNEHRRSAM
jgi:hypothetical protein